MNKKEFAKRRRQLMRMMGDDAIALVPTAPERVRNRDVHYPFRPDSDFYYLTGFGEPDAVAVLIPGRKAGEYLLFCRERNPALETWTGERAGPEGAVERYGADDAFPIDDIDDILPGLLENRERVYYTMGCYAEFDQRVIGWVNQVRSRARSGTRAPGEFVSLEHLLHDLRLYKSPAEVKAMRRAVKISVEAHRRAMRAARPGMKEYEVEAELDYVFRRHGCGSAYPAIVGSGANGCVLHYVSNNDTIGDGELLLIDAGAEFDCYAADITRTFPASGRFTKAQRAVYDVVLEAQQAAIEAVRPGNDWNSPHQAAVRALTEGMVSLGILKGRPAELIKKEAYRRFFMHRTGHWLGMDVHDVGDYKIDGHWRELEPGMTLTVEPGLYIPPGSKKVAKKWWGIGVRIEDDVLVTDEGCEVLSEAMEKEPEAVEAISQSNE